MNPDCHCELAGYCTRHKVKKATRLVELCKQRGPYWDAWEERRGPGQREPAMQLEPKPEPAYNHWAVLHYYAVKHQYKWNENQAKLFYRNWVAAIPNSRGCGCQKKWVKLDVPFSFNFPEAFFACSVEGHNTVNMTLAKPTITLPEATAIWWPEIKNDAT